MREGMELGPSQAGLYVVVPFTPPLLSKAMKNIEHSIGKLTDPVVFGALQQDSLEKIPSSARMLVVPVPLESQGQQRLGVLRASRITIVEGTEATDCVLAALEKAERISVMTAAIHFLVRPLKGALLYVFAESSPGQFREFVARAWRTTAPRAWKPMR
jgi:hypothetical protein